MAQNPSINHFATSTIYDDRGSPVLVIGTRKYTVIDANGVSEYAESDSIQLVDGLAWSPALATGANAILLTCCMACRYPPLSFFLTRARPTHGLLAVRNARTCVACGAVCCPRHRRLSGDHWRCLPCWQRRQALRLLRPVFFRAEEE